MLKKPYSKEKIVCLNIGEDSIKGIEIETLPPLKDLPFRFILDKFYIKNFKELTCEVLKEFFLKANFSTQKVRVCLERIHTLTRYIELPKMELKEFKNALKFEVEKCIPFSIEEVYFDGDILEEYEQKMRVIVAVCKKKLIDSILDLFNKINIFVELINLESLALINFFNYFFKANTEAGLLNIGDKVSSFTILRAQIPFLTRVIALGRYHFLKEDNFNSFENLLREIKLTLDYFETQTSNSVKKMFITGEGAYISKITDFFTENLNIPVEKLSIENKIDFKDPSTKSNFLKEENTFHACLGLGVS